MVRRGRALVRRQPGVEVVGVINYNPADAHVGATSATHAQLLKSGFGEAGVCRRLRRAQLGTVVLRDGIHFFKSPASAGTARLLTPTCGNETPDQAPNGPSPIWR